MEILKKPAVKVFVATTVMLTFISFWRAAAIVLSDLASSAYYVGGDAEKVIGKSAPWFVLAVMLFSYAVRSIYIESSSMFVRGGVYRVVKRGTRAAISPSSRSPHCCFDYVLTGPISSVSAGQYLVGFVTDFATHHGLHSPLTDAQDQLLSAAFAVAGNDLFLVEEHSGHPRVQRPSPAHHADHDRDGGRADRLVRNHADHASRAICRRSRREPTFPWITNRWDGCLHSGVANLTWILHAGWLRTLGPGHERRGIPRPGESRDRAPQAEEPRKSRAGHLRLQPACSPRWFRFSR